jgi:hypothetical protein
MAAFTRLDNGDVKAWGLPLGVKSCFILPIEIIPSLEHECGILIRKVFSLNK